MSSFYIITITEATSNVNGRYITIENQVAVALLNALNWLLQELMAAVRTLVDEQNESCCRKCWLLSEKRLLWELSTAEGTAGCC